MIKFLNNLFKSKTVVEEVLEEEKEEEEKEEEEKEEEKPEQIIAGLSVEEWDKKEVTLGTLDTIEENLETYEDTVGVVKAYVDDEVVLVGSALDNEGGGIKKAILDEVKEELVETPHINEEEVEIAVIEVGTTDIAVEVTEKLEKALVDKYDL